MNINRLIGYLSVVALISILLSSPRPSCACADDDIGTAYKQGLVELPSETKESDSLR